MICAARIAGLLSQRYQIDVARLGPRLVTTRLGELDLDSLSLLSFLSDVEQEFQLRLEELEQIAHRECTLGKLIALCRSAAARALTSRTSVA